MHSVLNVLHSLVDKSKSLLTTLKDKNYSEKMNKMQRRELSEFEACFTFSCPKFLVSSHNHITQCYLYLKLLYTKQKTHKYLKLLLLSPQSMSLSASSSRS